MIASFLDVEDRERLEETSCWLNVILVALAVAPQEANTPMASRRVWLGQVSRWLGLEQYGAKGAGRTPQSRRIDDYR